MLLVFEFLIHFFAKEKLSAFWRSFKVRREQIDCYTLLCSEEAFKKGEIYINIYIEDCYHCSTLLSIVHC